MNKISDQAISQPEISNDESTFSLSISDLMSALLLIFVLLLSVTLLQLSEQKEDNKERLDMISEQEDAKRSIIAQLKGEMEQFDIEVDPKTGVIRVKEAILFDISESDLKQEGKEFLRKFIPKYAEILLARGRIRNQIAHVIIEGHADNTAPPGSNPYKYNMELSMKRAYSVAAHIFSEPFNGFQYKNIFQKKLSVNGRSYESPISDNGTEEGRRKNRRVEFKFSFIDWTTLQNLKSPSETFQTPF